MKSHHSYETLTPWSCSLPEFHVLQIQHSNTTPHHLKNNNILQLNKRHTYTTQVAITLYKLY